MRPNLGGGPILGGELVHADELTRVGSSDDGTHHARLLSRIEREYRYPRVEFVVVQTREGHGVLHGVWAIPGSAAGGFRSCYVDKRFLSAEWLRIHRADVVSINEYHHGTYRGWTVQATAVTDAITQYIRGQRAIVRSWSRTPSIGVPIRKTWRWLKRQLGKAEALKAWNTLLTGGTIVLGGRELTLKSLAEERRIFRRLRSDLLGVARGMRMSPTGFTTTCRTWTSPA